MSIWNYLMKELKKKSCLFIYYKKVNDNVYFVLKSLVSRRPNFKQGDYVNIDKKGTRP